MCSSDLLDRVWSIQYQRETLPEADEERLLQRLRGAGGPLVPMPHTWGAMASQLEGYPQVKLWMYQKIRAGSVPALACQELKSFLMRKAIR